MIEEFLKEIPSFPLDVTVAAYYLKETGMSFGAYLAEIRRHNVAFDTLQGDILENANEYSKTRYSIITLSVKSIMRVHSEYQELLLFISLLDSQNIPKELLAEAK